MIFAAGKGTRLKPFTDHHPKALAPAGGIPMLERVTGRVIAAGATEIVINIHHFAGQVKDFVDSLAVRTPEVKFLISDESETLLDTGGGLLKARKFLDIGETPFLVHNADILTSLDLRDMMSHHLRSGADVTLLAMPRKTSRYLYFDRHSARLCGWCDLRTGRVRPEGFVPDEPRQRRLAFGGIHIISPRIFPCLERYSRTSAGPDGAFSITPFYCDNCRELDIRAYSPDPETFMWLDIGTPEKLAQADAILTRQGTDHIDRKDRND